MISGRDGICWRISARCRRKTEPLSPERTTDSMDLCDDNDGMIANNQYRGGT